MANTQYIDYEKNNIIYSPGLVSNEYSSTEQKGNTGKRGNGIFFFPNIINGNEDNYNYVREKLNSNKHIIDENIVIEYNDYDMIIDSTGDVYYVNDIKKTKDFSGIDTIGNLRLSTTNDNQ